MTSVTIEYVYMNNKNEKIQIDASYNKEFATVIIYIPIHVLDWPMIPSLHEAQKTITGLDNIMSDPDNMLFCIDLPNSPKPVKTIIPSLISKILNFQK